jgi:hypothetical protein
MQERTSALASHLPEADRRESGSGLPELSHTFFGHADHHGIYKRAHLPEHPAAPTANASHEDPTKQRRAGGRTLKADA